MTLRYYYYDIYETYVRKYRLKNYSAHPPQRAFVTGVDPGQNNGRGDFKIH